MSIIMPAFPRRAQAPQPQPAPATDTPRGLVALVLSDGETWKCAPGGRWERMGDNLAVKAAKITPAN